jgi:AraC-like DNA-binding protein
MANRLSIDLRPLGIPEVPMLGRYDFREAQRGLDLHAHRDVLEICYLAKGRQLYRVGRRDFVLTGGDVFVAFPGEVHSTGEAPQEKGRLYWLQVLIPGDRVRFLNCPVRDGRLLIQQLLDLPHRHFAGEPALARILDEIRAAYQRPADPLRRITIQNRLVDFLLRVIACARQSPRASVSPPISHLLRYIEANAHQVLPLPALAARLGLSLPRLKARFKQEVGIPPAEYVLRCKVEAAKRRLAQPAANITTVAFELGFLSSQYFATVFKRYTGRTPRDFQRQLC